MTENMIEMVNKSTDGVDKEVVEQQKVIDIAREPIRDPREVNTNLRLQQDDLNLTTPDLEADKWYLNDEVEGIGGKPDFFHDKTFKTISDQAKAYSKARRRITELSNTLEKYGEVPTEYRLESAPNYEEIGITPLELKEYFPKIKNWARESHMSNKSFNSAIKVFNEVLQKRNKASKEKVEKYYESELGKIDEAPGEAKRKLHDLVGWIEQKFPTIDKTSLKNMLSSSDSYRILDHIRGVAPGDSAPAVSPKTKFDLREDLRSKMADKRYAVDLVYTAHVDKLYKALIEKEMNMV